MTATAAAVAAPLLLLLLQFGAVDSHWDESKCGTSKSCVPETCTPTGCPFRAIFTPSLDGQWLAVELHSTDHDPNDVRYMAVGFSADPYMGEEPVAHCFVPPENGTNDKPSAHFTYNNGKSNQGLPADIKALEEDHIQFEHAHNADGKLYCKFSVRTKPTDQVPTDSKYFPTLTGQPVVALLARGPARKPTSIGVHGFDPTTADFPIADRLKRDLTAVTADKEERGHSTPSDHDHDAHETPSATSDANAAETEPPKQEADSTNSAEPMPTTLGPPPAVVVQDHLIESPATRLFLVRLHGALMLLGWLWLITGAMMAARYLREHWPSSRPRGLRIWFHLHRSLNFLALALILVSTLIIFVAKDMRWHGPKPTAGFWHNMGPGSWHSLLGAISVVLAVLQPIGALCRCAPHSSARSLFNGLHRFNGITSYLFALAAIWFAVIYFHVWTGFGYPVLFFALFCVLIVLAVVLFEVLARKKLDVSDKMAFEMHRANYANGSNGRRERIVNPKILHGITALFVFAFISALALSVVLILAMYL